MTAKKEQPATPAKSKDSDQGGYMKALLLIAVILVAEVAVVIGVIVFIAGPSTVDASGIATTEEIVGDQRVVETLVIHAKLPNSRSGVTYLYDTEIYVQTIERNVERVQRELDQFNNEIRAEMTAIWRTAEPHHFQEPNLETLTRHVEAKLRNRFGTDPQTEEPIVKKCVLVMGTGFRIDN